MIASNPDFSIVSAVFQEILNQYPQCISSIILHHQSNDFRKIRAAKKNSFALRVSNKASFAESHMESI